MSTQNTAVIALLGQPNSGKSSVFNRLTGSRQHVGNWPGKTVEKKEGRFTNGGRTYIVADLPGSYSLSARSDEEVITRGYIESGKADVVCILADASQLSRSLYMLADFACSAGRKTPAVLLLNMMDVAKAQGVEIDAAELEKRLGVPVLPFVAIEKASYEAFYAAVDRAIAQQTTLPALAAQNAAERYKWIDELLDGAVKKTGPSGARLTKFDRLALSPKWGMPLLIGILLVVFVAAMIFSTIAVIPAFLLALYGAPPLREWFEAIGMHPFFTSLICDVLLNALYFVVMMCGFVLGVTFGFNLLEEMGYIARVSFLCDGFMSKLGLQGKAVMPCFMGLGCTIAGAAGTRVIDNWGQRVLTIAVAWAVPCGATWAVMPSLALTFFGPVGGVVIIFAILAFMVLFMALTARLFGPSLAPESERAGMVMELPPYHKPHFKALLYSTFLHTVDIFKRTSKTIFVISVLFFLVAYSSSGNPADSLIYKVGIAIEPVTRIFGLGWQTFMAFLASMISKESLLGVLNTLYSAEGASLVGATFGAKMSGSGSAIAGVLAANISKPEALAFLFAITFNMPCINALAATVREVHSAKWTAKIALYYIAVSLLLACVVYHVGLLIF